MIKEVESDLKDLTNLKWGQTNSKDDKGLLYQ